MKPDSGEMSANPNQLSNYLKSRRPPRRRPPEDLVDPRHPGNPNQPMDPDDDNSPSNPDNRDYPLNPESPVNAIRDPGASMRDHGTDRARKEAIKAGKGVAGNRRGTA